MTLFFPIHVSKMKGNFRFWRVREDPQKGVQKTGSKYSRFWTVPGKVVRTPQIRDPLFGAKVESRLRPRFDPLLTILGHVGLFRAVRAKMGSNGLKGVQPHEHARMNIAL